LVSLTDVGIDDPQEGNALMYDSATGTWVNKNVNLDEIGQLAIVGPVSGQVLKYNGVNWANADDEGGLLPKVTVYGTAAGYRLGKGGQFIVMTSLGSNTFVANVTDYGQWDVYDGTAATVYESVEVDTVKEYTVDLMTPEGSTVLPTDDIQIWLACAGITDKAYTTISQVLSDTSTLSALIASNNAVDYMVRSTTWASNVCSDATAMSYIGLNNYCANTLLADAEWLTAIANSAYMQSVLNTKNPTMTGTNTPSGECIEKNGYGGTTYMAWKAFDGNISTLWASNSTKVGSGVGYMFTQANKGYCASFAWSGSSNYQPSIIQIQGSNSGNENDWDILGEYGNSYYPNTETKYTLIYSSTGTYKYYRVIMTAGSSVPNFEVAELNFYGREDV
jgi:hypothetical protein